MLDFDYAFQPVARNRLVVYGSSADDSVRAIDAHTGKLVWTFVTGGPVRFAPHLVGDRCYVASDDGCVYCLELKNGNQIWRFRAALDDRNLLANGRITSRWPCRSGVVVEHGVAYVTAGMWPSEGVYLYALEADSGKIRWCNDTSCYDYLEYPHAPSVSFGGPAPQGYMLVGNKTVVVPTGRGAPAAYDAETGKLLHFWSNSPNRGGTWATLAHNRIFVSAIAWQPDQPVRLGESVPHRADSVAALALRTGKEEWPIGDAIKPFIEGSDQPRWRSQVGHGILSRQRVLFAGNRIYAIGNGKADAFEITGPASVKHLWSVPSPRPYSEALTSNALLIGGQDQLVAIDPENGKVLDQAAIPGQVRGIAVAEGRVIISTEQGLLASLSKDGVAKLETTTPSFTQRPKGYAVVAGTKDAAFAESIAKSESVHVLCLIADPAVAQSEKQRLAEMTSLYGSRVVVATTDTSTNGELPARFAFRQRRFVKSEAKEIIDACGTLSLTAAMRRQVVLRSQHRHRTFRQRFRNPTSRDREVRRWHEAHRSGAAGGGVRLEQQNRCRQVGPVALEFQWFGDPNGQLLVSRHAKPRTPVAFCGRRLFSANRM
ncbi:MAG: PQQ-binding-like beta-propeller repeat protein [Gemmataceae bacterium]